MLTLAFDTATGIATSALVDGDEVLGERSSRAQTLLEAQREAIGFNRIITDGKVAKISVVGVGMKSHAGVAATMFRAMADRGINIQAISTSEINV